MKTRVLLVVLVTVLSGCATNDFTKFYRENAAITKEVAAQKLIPFSGTTQIYSTNDIPKDVAELSKRGYIVLGESAFQGAGRTTEEQSFFRKV